MLKMAVNYNSIAPSEIRTPPNNGQRPRSQYVHYSEVPLYIHVLYNLHGTNWIVKSFEPVGLGLSVVYVAAQLMVPAESALSGVRV